MFESVRWMKGEEGLSVFCIKVVVEGKGRDESAEGSGIHDEKQRTKNSALRNATRRGIRKIDGCHI